MYDVYYETDLFQSLISLAVTVLILWSVWKIFVKAGKPGWAAIIPFYDSYILFEIIYGSGWKFLLLLIPFYNIYLYFKTFILLAHKFGKSTGFGIGIVFLPFVFLPILGFGDAEYHG